MYHIVISTNINSPPPDQSLVSSIYCVIFLTAKLSKTPQPPHSMLPVVDLHDLV